MFSIFHELICTALETHESTSFSPLQFGFAIALCSKSRLTVLLVPIRFVMYRCFLLILGFFFLFVLVSF